MTADTLAGFLIAFLALAMIGIGLALRRSPAFGLVLLNRWVRWILFGVGAAFLLREWGISGRPYWALVPAFLLLWILVESVYTWLAVRALSLSEIPVYPNYREIAEEVRWPVSQRFLEVKEEIRALGFTVGNSLAADLGGGLRMRSLLYFDEGREIRLQVVFAPRAAGSPALFLIFSSAAADKRWVTDNVWLPFGSVFPADWRVERRPFTVSARRLLDRHRRNLAKWGAVPEPYGPDPVETLNAEQDALDRAGTDHGILVPRGQRPEFGKLTGDGRYRVWKQILLLNYLGRVGGRAVG